MIFSVEEILNVAQCASFMQRVKMAYWDTVSADVSHVAERDLDTILILAWDDLNKK